MGGAGDHATGTGATILAPSGPVLGHDEAIFFRDADPFGFILFARNIESRDQTRTLTAALRDAVGRDAPILIDQEGGRVSRFPVGLGHEFPPALDMAETSRDPIRALWVRARLIAHDLRDLGIDVNCAPLADIARPDTHAVLRNRCYGTTADEVTVRARAVADGHTASGVSSVLKHMPGHGRAFLDSHLALPVVDTDLATLEATDFAPFRALADLSMGMTAHLVFKAIDPETPSTLSPAVLAFLRARIGFANLLMTDDISMQALPGTLAYRSEGAIAAGCDLVLHCTGVLAEMEAVVAAAGLQSDDARRRAAAAIAGRPTAAAIDIDGLRAELLAMEESCGHA
ncbi:MAG: glycoside hydrolase family 3 N-terminal domain-containing protein [Pseudomonadota bacterium]